MTKRAGIGAGFEAGSVRQRYESANPDLYQNDKDPVHCLHKRIKLELFI